MGKNCVFLAISYTERRKVENAIRSYLESKGLEVITGRDVASGGNLCNEIITLIEECDFGVVVYNELRHNISYEWGLLDVTGKYVVVLKDENIHIDLDYELSDKKGTIFTPFYGEDTEEEIIKQLKENKGLERALENNVEKRISTEDTPEAKKASELLVKSDLQLGELSKEIKELPNSKKILKALGKIKNLTAEGHRIKGNAYKAEKNFDESLKEYTLAIKIDPNDDIAYHNRGYIYTKIENFDEAIEDYKKATELDPTYPDTYKNLAEAYILKGKYEISFKTAQKILEKSKNMKDIIISKFLITISLILQGKGKKEEGELIEYVNQNKGYELTFEFDTLRNGLKDSKNSEKIDKLIQIVEENATD